MLSLGPKKAFWSRSLDSRVSRSQIPQEGQRFGSGMKYSLSARSDLSLVAATWEGTGLCRADQGGFCKDATEPGLPVEQGERL